MRPTYPGDTAKRRGSPPFHKVGRCASEKGLVSGFWGFSRRGSKIASRLPAGLQTAVQNGTRNPLTCRPKLARPRTQATTRHKKGQGHETPGLRFNGADNGTRTHDPRFTRVRPRHCKRSESLSKTRRYNACTTYKSISINAVVHNCML